MMERPILFSAPMVRALLDGTKTQTRRVVKPVGNDGGFVLCERDDGSMWPHRSDDGESCFVTRRERDGDYLDEVPMRCPYGKPGDRLWVRETWAPCPDGTAGWVYLADRPARYTGEDWRWHPSIHMPRAASRLTLEVTSVRVERLHQISRGDAMAEGCPFANMQDGESPVRWYEYLWRAINGPDSWDANPWVWVVEFRKAHNAELTGARAGAAEGK